MGWTMDNTPEVIAEINMRLETLESRVSRLDHTTRDPQPRALRRTGRIQGPSATFPNAGDGCIWRQPIVT